MLPVIAQTATALPEVPKTGNATIDNSVAIVIGLFGAGGFGTALWKHIQATGLGAKAADLFTTVQGVVRGVAEAGREDIVTALMSEIPDMTFKRANEIAEKIQERIEKRIKARSLALGTERILKPIVKETKSAMKKYEESKSEIKTPPPEAAFALSAWLLIIALVAILFVSVGCQTPAEKYVAADAKTFAVTDAIVREVAKRQPEKYRQSTLDTQGSWAFRLRGAGATPTALPLPADFFDGVFAGKIEPAAITVTPTPNGGVR